MIITVTFTKSIVRTQHYLGREELAIVVGHRQGVVVLDEVVGPVDVERVQHRSVEVEEDFVTGSNFVVKKKGVAGPVALEELRLPEVVC